MNGSARIALAAMLLVAATTGASAASASKVSSFDHLYLWPVKKIGVSWRFDKPGWMSFVAFSPDGTMVASDGPATPDDTSGDLTIWSFPQGKFIRRLPGPPWSMSADWKYYADQNRIRATQTGQPVASHVAAYSSQALSADGAYGAAWSYGDSPDAHIEVFALKDGNRIAAFGRHTAFSLAISPDGRLLASGGWDIVTLWNLRTGKRIGALRGFGRYVKALSFSRDGKLLAAGTDAGGLQIWDVRRRKRLHGIAFDGLDVSAPAFSPNGRFVAVGVYGTGTVWLVDVRSGKILDHRKVSDLGCGAAAFSPDGRYLIVPSTGGLVTWPVDVGGTIRVFRVLN